MPDKAYILKLYDTIDNSINLYFASHTANPPLEVILDSCTNLLKKKVTVDDFLKLMAVDEKAFNLTRPGKTGSIRISKATLQRGQFLARLEQSNLTAVPVLAELVKVTSGKLTKLPKTKIIKNDSSKFKFKPKDERLQQANQKGLTLLDRIKLKEMLKREAQDEEEPETKHNNFLKSKLRSVYDIIYQTHIQQKRKAYSITSLSETIGDSLSNPISQEDILDILRIIETRLTSVSLVKISSVFVLKISKLDRESDLLKLN